MIHTPDGGEIEIRNGRVVLDDGFTTAMYLSMFGGNLADAGVRPDDPAQWWGNYLEAAESRKQRSQTQYLLRSIPATPGNRERIRQANLADLAWMTESIASEVDSRVVIPALNRAGITIAAVIQDSPFTAYFERPWKLQ